MATLNTAKTRLGAGGPSKNYTRPFTAKAAEVVAAIINHPMFTRTVGKLIN